MDADKGLSSPIPEGDSNTQSLLLLDKN